MRHLIKLYILLVLQLVTANLPWRKKRRTLTSRIEFQGRSHPEHLKNVSPRATNQLNLYYVSYLTEKKISFNRILRVLRRYRYHLHCILVDKASISSLVFDGLSLMTLYKSSDLFCVDFQNGNLVMEKLSAGKLLKMVKLSAVSLKNVDLAS